MRKVTIISAALLAVLASTGCSALPGSKPSASPTPQPFDVTGTISVPIDVALTYKLQDSKPTIEKPCIPRDGFDDIDEGAQVVVLDANGTKVALGELGTGGLANGASSEAFISSVCEFPISVSDVPNSGGIYSVHVGNEARGEQSYTKSELEDGIALTLGD